MSSLFDAALTAATQEFLAEHGDEYAERVAATAARPRRVIEPRRPTADEREQARTLVHRLAGWIATHCDDIRFVNALGEGEPDLVALGPLPLELTPARGAPLHTAWLDLLWKAPAFRGIHNGSYLHWKLEPPPRRVDNAYAMTVGLHQHPLTIPDEETDTAERLIRSFEGNSQ